MSDLGVLSTPDRAAHFTPDNSRSSLSEALHMSADSPCYPSQQSGLRANAPEFFSDMAYDSSKSSYHRERQFAHCLDDHHEPLAVPLYGGLHSVLYFPQHGTTSVGKTLKEAVYDFHMNPTQLPMCNQYAPENQHISSPELLSSFENMPASKKQAQHILCRCNGQAIWMPAAALEPDHTCQNTSACGGGLHPTLPSELENAYVSLTPSRYSKRRPSSESTYASISSHATKEQSSSESNPVSPHTADEGFLTCSKEAKRGSRCMLAWHPKSGDLDNGPSKEEGIDDHGA